MADEVSKSGVWLDTKAQKIVHKQPEEGYQIVRPGGTITADRQATIDLFTQDAETRLEERNEFNARVENSVERNVEHAAAVDEGHAGNPTRAKRAASRK